MSAPSGSTKTSLGEDLVTLLDERLAEADAELATRYPGDPGTRQPVHTVYVTADRFRADTPSVWGAAASELLRRCGSTTASLAEATGIPASLLDEVYPRVADKLRDEPIEDLRVDFEDGYGHRPDEEEDRAASAAAAAIVELADRPQAPPFIGIRFKSFEAPTRRRGLRTLDLVVSGVLAAGGLPAGFVLTLPKVTSAAQVAAMTEVCARLEDGYGLPDGRLRFEIQVETPQAILGADGTATVARMVTAADGRCVGLHYGTYDYSAGLGITAANQSLDHPVADHAKAVMQLAAAQTGVRLSDGSTNVVPTGDCASVHAAWRLHSGLVTRSLERGYYQGWDMHPGHLPTRYLATYAFFRRTLPATAARVRAYVARAETDVMDEPATAQALAVALLRGIESGAVTADEAQDLTGVDRQRLQALAARRDI